VDFFSARVSGFFSARILAFDWLQFFWPIRTKKVSG
jgi:hypothetical protein